MIRTGTVKYIQTYDTSENLIFAGYYDLVADPIENTNLLADASRRMTHRQPSCRRCAHN